MFLFVAIPVKLTEQNRHKHRMYDACGVLLKTLLDLPAEVSSRVRVINLETLPKTQTPDCIKGVPTLVLHAEARQHVDNSFHMTFYSEHRSDGCSNVITGREVMEYFEAVGRMCATRAPAPEATRMSSRRPSVSKTFETSHHRTSRPQSPQSPHMLHHALSEDTHDRPEPEQTVMY